MTDTGFFVPKEKLNRFAEFYNYDKDGKLHAVGSAEGLNHDFAAKPALSSGGGGLVSTATDYMRFCQMLLNGGQLDGVRMLSPLHGGTHAHQRVGADRADSGARAPASAWTLRFTPIRLPPAVTTARARYWWGGAAGTWFWIDPVNELIVIGMIQQAAGTGAAAVNGVPDVRGLSHTYTYQAILD